MTVTSPKGFSAAGLGSGIKITGAPDLALVVTENRLPATCAGVFTPNKACAAPVRLSKSNLEKTKGYATGVLINSGNANAATGQLGLEHATQSIAQVAGDLGIPTEQLLVCSTGLIGITLPVEAILNTSSKLVAELGSSEDDGHRAANAIMTTDTFAKEVEIARDGVTIGAMAKGAAMLEPAMATMLAVITTDLQADSTQLQGALRLAVNESFNQLSVDGAMSTNDTVLVFANGQSNKALNDEALTDLLTETCCNLANQMAKDAEGATKVATISVKGAKTRFDALSGARKVANSLLVKCSLFGADPYWGRIISELGSTMSDFDIDKISISYGDYCVCSGGIAVAVDDEGLRNYMQGSQIDISVEIGMGYENANLTFTDISCAYIEENMRTS